MSDVIVAFFNQLWSVFWSACCDIYEAIYAVILETPSLLVCFSPLILLWLTAFLLARKRFSWVFFWVGFGSNVVLLANITYYNLLTENDLSVRIIFYWLFFYALTMFLGGSVANRRDRLNKGQHAPTPVNA